jgi:hypothetical protein
VLIDFISTTTVNVRFNINSYRSFSYTIRRLCFYILLLNVRGWILYVLFNEIEDRLVTSLSSSSASTSCWYITEGWFQQHTEQTKCIGRPFDFSDHIVLYYGQLLPIALMETLYAFQNPYWVLHATPERSTSQNFKKIGHMTIRLWKKQSLQYIIPFVLIGSQLYLQLITATGAYKTSAYFHTPLEVIAGFAVSMIITLPLCMLQCNVNASWAIYGRSIFFR